jgi:diguanylate cyclase (GGDEF)-like protein
MTTATTRVLLIEDNPADARLLREALDEIDGCHFEIFYCETMAEARASLVESRPDVILSDLGLPDVQGLETVRDIHTLAPSVPVVILTALNDDFLGRQILRDGAQDYLVKGQIDGPLLWRALRYAMERHQVQLGMLALALVDDLTGLNNRRGFFALADHHASLAYRTGKKFLIAFVDLDGLKGINDAFGHQEGNRALVDAAMVLKDCVRQSDILARIGGDEFAILIAATDENDLDTVRQRIDRKLGLVNAYPGRRYALGFSIGIAPCDAVQRPNIEKLLERADARMYLEKNNKRAAHTLPGTGEA